MIDKWNALSLLVVGSCAFLYVFAYSVSPFQSLWAENGSVYVSLRFHGFPNWSFYVNSADIGLSPNASCYQVFADGLPMRITGDRVQYGYSFHPRVFSDNGTTLIFLQAEDRDLLGTDFFMCRRLFVRVHGEECSE